jgi:hypothetical protein
MNTTGIQNYLSNVFRPIVSYDTVSSNFVPKLELSNIDTYSGNVVSVLRADVGDSNFNVYVGSNAGNSITNLNSCSNVSAFGYAAGNGISNDLNSVYVGYRAGANNIATRSIIGIGSGAGGGSIGLSNIFIGTNTKSATGSRNIFLGHEIDLSSVSDQIRIGYRNKIPIAADMSRNWVGLGGVLSPINGSATLDVSGITQSTGGYYSIQNTAAATPTANIGILKKGFIFVSALDVNNASVNYAASVFFSSTADSFPTVTMYSTSNGNTSIVLLGSNIIIQDPTIASYNYNITYFPLP